MMMKSDDVSDSSHIAVANDMDVGRSTQQKTKTMRPRWWGVVFWILLYHHLNNNSNDCGHTSDDDDIDQYNCRHDVATMVSAIMISPLSWSSSSSSSSSSLCSTGSSICYPSFSSTAITAMSNCCRQRFSDFSTHPPPSATIASRYFRPFRLSTSMILSSTSNYYVDRGMTTTPTTSSSTTTTTITSSSSTATISTDSYNMPWDESILMDKPFQLEELEDKDTCVTEIQFHPHGIVQLGCTTGPKFVSYYGYWDEDYTIHNQYGYVLKLSRTYSGGTRNSSNNINNNNNNNSYNYNNHNTNMGIFQYTVHRIYRGAVSMVGKIWATDIVSNTEINVGFFSIIETT
jgi:hypothetical protein